jgi:hypothetical protein
MSRNKNNDFAATLYIGISKHKIEEEREHRSMAIRTCVKPRKEAATKSPRKKKLIANPFKKIRKTPSTAHLCLEIGPSSSGQNIEGICDKHRHGFRSVQDPWSFLLDESSSAEIDIFQKLSLRKKTKNNLHVQFQRPKLVHSGQKEMTSRKMRCSSESFGPDARKC